MSQLQTPRSARAADVDIQPFADVVAALRAPDGCPWDREQTHRSLLPYVVEEAHELVDAVEDGDDRAVCEELGDVLLQVVLHAQIAAERGAFSLQDVADGIRAKMVRRHPHVFGDATAASAAEVEANWKAAKRAEGRSTLGGVPRSLPPLDRAQRVAARARSVGFDWPDHDQALDKLDEECAELREAVASGEMDRATDELGDVLFMAACLGARLGVDPSRALRGTVAKFERRFAHVETRLAERGRTPETSELDEMDAFWDEAKAAERAGASD